MAEAKDGKLWQFSLSFPLAVDHSVTTPMKIRSAANMRLLSCERSTPRRLYELGILALRPCLNLVMILRSLPGEKDLRTLAYL